MKDDQLSLLVDMYNPYSVMEEVKNILLLIDPDYDLGIIEMVFKDIIELFMGNIQDSKPATAPIMTSSIPLISS